MSQRCNLKRACDAAGNGIRTTTGSSKTDYPDYMGDFRNIISVIPARNPRIHTEIIVDLLYPDAPILSLIRTSLFRTLSLEKTVSAHFRTHSCSASGCVNFCDVLNYGRCRGFCRCFGALLALLWSNQGVASTAAQTRMSVALSSNSNSACRRCFSCSCSRVSLSVRNSVGSITVLTSQRRTTD
jgi:hypothetical protein